MSYPCPLGGDRARRSPGHRECSSLDQTYDGPGRHPRNHGSRALLKTKLLITAIDLFNIIYGCVWIACFIHIFINFRIGMFLWVFLIGTKENGWRNYTYYDCKLLYLHMSRSAPDVRELHRERTSGVFDWLWQGFSISQYTSSPATRTGRMLI